MQSKGVKVLAYWFVPSSVAVMLTARYGAILPSQYLNAAFNEGIGPHLWNVIGTMGLVLTAFAILVPTLKWPARWAASILMNTYAIGGLSFGILAGQFVSAIASSNIELWRTSLIGVTGFILLANAILLNFATWLLGGLVSRDSRLEFMSKIADVDFRLRFLVALTIGGLPIGLFSLER